jgi:hypothetical protein
VPSRRCFFGLKGVSKGEFERLFQGSRETVLCIFCLDLNFLTGSTADASGGALTSWRRGRPRARRMADTGGGSGTAFASKLDLPSGGLIDLLHLELE